MGIAVSTHLRSISCWFLLFAPLAAVAGSGAPTLAALADSVAVRAGDPAPAFSLPVLANPASASEAAGTFPLIDLSSYRGRVVYLDFWAVSCRRCRATMPALSAMRDTLSRDDVEVLAISTDTNPRDALAYLEANPVGYPVISDPAGTVADDYGVEVLPTAFMIDRNGTVSAVFRGVEAEDLAAIRERLVRLSLQEQVASSR